VKEARGAARVAVRAGRTAHQRPTERPEKRRGEARGRAAAKSEFPERWRALRKTECGLRLLRGDTSRTPPGEDQLPARELESWRRSSSTPARAGYRPGASRTSGLSRKIVRLRDSTSG
jgi:hypothetical protein